MDTPDDRPLVELRAGHARVRVGDQTVPLEFLQAVSLGKDTAPPRRPVEAVADVRCACGAVSGVAAAVEYDFYDDEHFGSIDIWYRSRHTARCAACATPFVIELRFTLCKDQLAGTESLVLDRVHAKGGAIVL